MHLVSFADTIEINFAKSAGCKPCTFEPYRAYVLSNSQYKRIEADPKRAPVIFKTSKLDNRLPNFHATAEAPGRLFFYNGAGGYGDQVLALPVAAYLAKMGYEVDVFTDPGNDSCWWCQPFVRAIDTLPIPYSTLENYKQVCWFEDVTNMDEHDDQLHPVDAMFRRIGIDPLSVPPEEKCLRPIFTPHELSRGANLTASLKLPQKQFAIVQLAASVPLRSFKPEEAIVYQSALALAFPDIAWINLTDQYQDSAYRQRIQESGLANLYAYTFPSLRDSWSAIAAAKLVVGVDSMAVHVAGSCGTPCIGIWGPVHPLMRTKYYQNHRPLFHRDACQFAPCFSTVGGVLPPFCPSLPAKTSCGVMLKASPEELVATARGILS